MATFEVLTSSNVIGGGGGGSSYLVYTALLSQTGTDAPTVSLKENTLGGTVVWTRVTPGVYNGTLAGAFLVDKTIPIPFGTAPVSYMPIGNSTLPDFYWTVVRGSDDIIQLIVNDINFSGAELSTALDSYSGGLLVEIRVYP